MKVQRINEDIHITEIEDFDLFQTMLCGQCFHFEVIDDERIALVAGGRLVVARQPQSGTLILQDMTIEEYDTYFRHYFDLDRDYASIKSRLLSEDELLKTSIESMNGVRILNQDYLETLISFIISQNKQIPHIKKIVAGISKEYGEYVGSVGDMHFYSFPDVDEIKKITEDGLRELKTGFRAPYIMDAIECYLDGRISEKELRESTTDECIDKLMQIKGVGSKVANCVALFSLEKRDAFPVDVWIKRIMENMYFHGDTKKEIIEEFAKKKYGEYGGYAQQYLFFYGRENGIGKNDKK
ncbi:MAG: DNA glycosylase [Lachnospiraceae bacterium]|nr:DNA-3-methyladenine glycosylase 2 family protein [Lachnospiraceae bacterium]MEE0958539.1 DNA glycosylase [Lachnospiraceae bacterium]